MMSEQVERRKADRRVDHTRNLFVARQARGATDAGRGSRADRRRTPSPIATEPAAPSPSPGPEKGDR
jgi:hypothetical protein